MARVIFFHTGGYCFSHGPLSLFASGKARARALAARRAGTLLVAGQCGDVSRRDDPAALCAVGRSRTERRCFPRDDGYAISLARCES